MFYSDLICHRFASKKEREPTPFDREGSLAGFFPCRGLKFFTDDPPGLRQFQRYFAMGFLEALFASYAV
jgi:hypothetical protein